MNKTISFGTDGIRAAANDFPFTKAALDALGKAFAQWATEKYGSNYPGILIGHDTRESCPRIKKDLIEGLSKYPVNIVDGGILPTPAVYQLMRDDERFNLGIVISASHNPYSDNGIKIFDKISSKISKDDEKRIESYFAHWYSNDTEPIEKKESLARKEVWYRADRNYIDHVTTLFSGFSLKGIKVFLDCANGALSSIAPKVFSNLSVFVNTTKTLPNGYNINLKCGATHPEELQQLVVLSKSHIGFAFDGDGDRLIVVNRSGEVKNGDDVLSLLLSLPEFSTTDTVVGTVMSNQGFEQALAQANKKLIRTNVGDKYVAEALLANNLPLGGEISGHTIIRNYMPTSDGLFVALKVLQAAILHNNWDLSTFQAFPQALLSVPIDQKKELSDPSLASIITAYEKKLPTSRILVRYSGTEKKLRVMVEAPSQNIAQSTAEALAKELSDALSNHQ